MITRIFRFFFPAEEVRIAKRARKTFQRHSSMVDEINRRCDEYDSLTDDRLVAKTHEFKERLAPHLEDADALKKALEDLLPEAFAVVKQACMRLCGQSWEAGGSTVQWDMVPYDEQLAGGVELHRTNIAEMATGEGKTLVAVLPLYLNALTGKGVHLITVNDYLARRDSEWMGKVYEFLGLSVGCILTNMSPPERQKSYACDVTYGTNNEFGFDYLRDNMAISPDHLVQREHYYAIVDEVDSVLIDEARTPLIISGTVDRTITQFAEMKPMVADLVREQSGLVNTLVSQAEEILKEAEALEKKAHEEKTYEAGIKLLQSRKGHPKHKRLSKIMNDAAMQRLVQRVEHDFMRDKRIPELEEELFFAVDERGHTIDLTQKGREALAPNDPDLFLVPDLVEVVAEIESVPGLSREEIEKRKEKAMAENEGKSETIHCLSQLLRAYTLYNKDDEYVIRDNKIVIVDEFTGRLMSGRRWSDGLHQAVEAKESVTVEKETQTLATITLQNYFRMYEKLAGMTGTAISEEAEFAHTYNMNVAVIPTHRPNRRLDDNDLIFRSEREKYSAIIEHVGDIHKDGMPVLVGTASVETSEKLSRMLQRAKISHSVLNAKFHEREAQIIREAGETGAVTIATNMAGRGTDIKLGPGVIRCKSEDFDGRHCAICPHLTEKNGNVDPDLAACGLHIVGTERHDARRIDRQLRGRSGRQGDPGYSLFYLSLEDELMRLFASERMANLMAKGFEEGEAMSHGIADRAIGQAQKKIEEINFERRKKTLEYDDVMNKQRKAIYGLRRRILLSKGPLTEEVLDIASEALSNELPELTGTDREADSTAYGGFVDWVRRSVPMIDLEGLDRPEDMGEPGELLDDLNERVAKAYRTKIDFFEDAYKDQPAPEGQERPENPGARMVGALTRWVVLEIIDTHWRDHLLSIDELREGIYLRSYGQLNPLTEYQREATLQFEEMVYYIHKEAFEHVFRATLVQSASQQRTSRVSFKKDEAGSASEAAESGQRRDPGDGRPPARAVPKTYRRSSAKVRPNAQCPCGSGKKYKKCCGRRGSASEGKSEAA